MLLLEYLSVNAFASSGSHRGRNLGFVARRYSQFCNKTWYLQENVLELLEVRKNFDTFCVFIAVVGLHIIPDSVRTATTVQEIITLVTASL